ncbi:MAG: DUF502 domain-containing protein [bacterium]
MSKSTVKHKNISKIRGNLFRGIAVLIPFYLTIIILKFLIQLISTPLSRPIRWLSRLFTLDIQKFPFLENILIIGVSLIITLLFIFFVGAFVQLVFGRRLMIFFERTFERLPLVSTIYRTFREFTRILTGESVEKYKNVVMVSLPGSKGKALGFVTGTITLEDKLPYLAVFVPTVPNISTGFLFFLPEDEVTNTSLTTEEAFKMIVSIGILNPPTKESQDIDEVTEA